MTEIPCNNNDEFLKGLTTPIRNKYFHGKLMDAFHFELEQCYVNRKRWLLNQLTLGRGVLCGLQVAPTKDGKQIVVGPGMAIDDFGREIIVPAASQPVDPRQPTDVCGRPSGDRITEPVTVHICLAYHECEADPVPILVGDCDRRPGCAPSLIRERYRILVRKGDAADIKTACGFPNAFAPPPEGQSLPLYPMLADRISQPCPESQSDPCVVLAQIRLPEGDAAIERSMIDPTFRPVVYSNKLLFELLLCLAQQAQAGGSTPAAPPKLTTVTELSWKHDDGIHIDKFMSGLAVTFSHKVEPNAKRNDAWFIVTVEYPIGATLTQLPALLPGTVFVQRVLAQEIKVDDRTISFKPDSRFKGTFEKVLQALGEDNSPLCRVVLNCNALTGENDRAVDGNFLGGDLPSGDGTPGGVFESWFTLNID